MNYLHRVVGDDWCVLASRRLLRHRRPWKWWFQTTWSRRSWQCRTTVWWQRPRHDDAGGYAGVRRDGAGLAGLDLDDQARRLSTQLRARDRTGRRLLCSTTLLLPTLLADSQVSISLVIYTVSDEPFPGRSRRMLC